MGKKSKMLNEDPILRKNFKLQKRKKERQLQKQKIKQEQLAEQKRIQELRLIEKKVQQDIEKHFEQQKLSLIHQNSKNKNISKSYSFASAFRNKEASLLNQLKKNDLTKSYQQQFTQNLPSFSLKISQHPYNHHFAQTLPKIVTELMTKHKKITQAMKMEQEIKAQINSMFSVKKVSDQPEAGNEKKKNWQYKKNEVISGKSQHTDLEKALQEEEKEEEPFIIDRKGKVQSEGLIGNKIFLLNKLALQNVKETKKIENQKMQVQNQEEPESPEEYQTVNKLISSYIDCIYVENKEEQSIQEFRKIVIKHIYQHQLECLKSLKENKKSKGFTNSKFLILTPYVGDAKAIFDLIEEEFMQDSEENLEPAVQEPLKKKKRTLQWVVQNKEKIEQNEDDEDDFFRVGIKILPRKKKVVYFSNFDSSDIIVASPIGLKSIINGQSGKKEISFLSSVEVLYVDRASVIMMQNWDHLLDIFNNLNYTPKYESLKNSINQIREEFLQLKGRIYRQNIIFSEFGFPELNSLKLNHFHNWQGSVTSKPIFSPVVLEKNEKVEKNFYKIELKEPKEDLEVRFEYFKRKFWDKIHNNDEMKKVVIFVNSYFEFVKLKGFLEKVNASFEAISEHTKKQKIQSRVSLFNNNSYRILLLTERAYYFGLCQIKKQRHIFFYSLPRNGFIYKELIENLQQDVEENSKIVCIYSKYDKFIVERLVGSAKAVEMVKEYCTNVSFIV